MNIDRPRAIARKPVDNGIICSSLADGDAGGEEVVGNDTGTCPQPGGMTIPSGVAARGNPKIRVRLDLFTNILFQPATNRNKFVKYSSRFRQATAACPDHDPNENEPWETTRLRQPSFIMIDVEKGWPRDNAPGSGRSPATGRKIICGTGNGTRSTPGHPGSRRVRSRP